MSQGIQAKAFTHGSDVYFNQGQYNPESSEGKRLLGHELTHVVQQDSNSSIHRARMAKVSPGDTYGQKNQRISGMSVHGPSKFNAFLKTSPTMVARDPEPAQDTDAERRRVVDEAARWFNAMAGQVQAMRRAAASALRTTTGRAEGPRAFHRHLNQEMLGRLLNNTISVFEAQRSSVPGVNFPAESPEQTRLGEAYARAIDQFGLAIEEAHTNTPNLAPAIRETEEARYTSNHLRWLEANPAAPLAAGVRTTFTQTEVDLSAQRHQRVSTQLPDLIATIHEYNLAGDGAQRLLNVLRTAVYRLAQDPQTHSVQPQQDTTLLASIQPVLNQLDGIQWAVSEAVGRLDQAVTRTRAFATNVVANPAVGGALQAHFSTRDPGYATLLADRLARMARELRGQGSLTIHAPNPSDRSCGTGSIGGGTSTTLAHAEPNQFYFCGNVQRGNLQTVITVLHETAHAVIPGRGSRGNVATGFPLDRAYAGERLMRRMTTEEALNNAESYAELVTVLAGLTVNPIPTDTVSGCTDAAPLLDALALAQSAHRRAWSYLEGAQSQLRSGNAIDTSLRSQINTHLGNPSDAELLVMLEDFGSLQSNATTWHVSHNFVCATVRDCPDGALAFDNRRIYRNGAVSERRRRGNVDIHLCPAYFSLSIEDRVRVTHAIMSLSTGDFFLQRPQNVWGYAGLALAIYRDDFGVPPAANLSEHLAADRAATP